MNWTEEFIGQCLAEVPPGKYRTRAGKELRDHLECRRRALAEAGRTEAEARAEALAAMGDPDRLRGEYRAAWNRTFQARAGRLAVIAGGCLLMGTLYLLTAMILSALGFTYDSTAAYPHTLTGRNFPILGGGPALVIFGSALFLIPFPLGALYLRARFRDARRPAVWVTLGLLAAWAGEKAAIISLSALIYQMPPGPDLLHRIARGGDVTGPWFTPAYIALTFLGCLILGQLFGRKTERRHKPA